MREGGWLWAGAAELERGGGGSRGNEKLDTHFSGTVLGSTYYRRYPTARNPLNTRDFMQKQNIQPDFCNLGNVLIPVLNRKMLK